MEHIAEETKKVMDQIAIAVFGMTKTEAIEKRICLSCKQPLCTQNIRGQEEMQNYITTGLCGRCS